MLYRRYWITTNWGFVFYFFFVAKKNFLPAFFFNEQKEKELYDVSTVLDKK